MTKDIWRVWLLLVPIIVYLYTILRLNYTLRTLLGFAIPLNIGTINKFSKRIKQLLSQWLRRKKSKIEQVALGLCLERDES